MATVTKKPSVKRGRPRKDVSTASIEGDEATLNAADVKMIAEIAGQVVGEALKAQRVVPDPVVLETLPITAEDAALMSDEEVAEFNERERQKAAARKKAQMNNRLELEKLSADERAKRIKGERDPSIIRDSINPNGEKMVDVVGKVRIKINETDMSDVDEHIRIPRSLAIRLQDQGKIEVMI